MIALRAPKSNEIKPKNGRPLTIPTAAVTIEIKATAKCDRLMMMKFGKSASAVSRTRYKYSA